MQEQPFDNADYHPYQTQVPLRRSGFSVASFVLGMLSVLFACTVFLPIPLAALGLLFAILSHRYGRKSDGMTKVGVITSLIGLVIGICLFVFAIVSAITMLRPENRDLLNQRFESFYGMDFDEYMEKYWNSIQ